jgi:hypothetical protein
MALINGSEPLGFNNLLNNMYVGNSRINIIVTGNYAINMSGYIGSANLLLYLHVNGVQFPNSASSTTSSGTGVASMVCLARFNAGDFVEMFVKQFNGSAVSFGSTSLTADTENRQRLSVFLVQ